MTILQRERHNHHQCLEGYPPSVWVWCHHSALSLYVCNLYFPFQVPLPKCNQWGLESEASDAMIMVYVTSMPSGAESDCNHLPAVLFCKPAISDKIFSYVEQLLHHLNGLFGFSGGCWQCDWSYGPLQGLKMENSGLLSEKRISEIPCCKNIDFYCSLHSYFLAGVGLKNHENILKTFRKHPGLPVLYLKQWVRETQVIRWRVRGGLGFWVEPRNAQIWRN